MPGMSLKMPFVSSVILTLVYERLMSVSVCPFGQDSVVAGGKIVRLAVTCPFFTAKSPLAVTGDWVRRLLRVRRDVLPVVHARVHPCGGRGRRVVDIEVVPETRFLPGHHEVIAAPCGTEGPSVTRDDTPSIRAGQPGQRGSGWKPRPSLDSPYPSGY